MGVAELCAAVLETAIAEGDWLWIKRGDHLAFCEVVGITPSVYERGAAECRQIMETWLPVKGLVKALKVKEAKIRKMAEQKLITMRDTPAGAFVERDSLSTLLGLLQAGSQEAQRHEVSQFNPRS